MVTRLSHFFLRTLRDDPADAEVASHRLLVRAGYIRRVAPGIFAWLPLGLRVKERIERIVRDEMAAAGAYEVHFPALVPADPYRQSGRWDAYGEGIFRLRDRRDVDYLLAPTHEELFTLLVRDLYSSYKDLPLTIYQIQDKYRDEARPRAGLLRGREFTMKDAYSFDSTDEGLDRSYQAQRDAYERIFSRLGLEYVIVNADNGLMGGARSEEFLHPIDIGEDTFVRSPGGYAANVEAFTTASPAPRADAAGPATIFDSPGTPTIATLVDHLRAALPHPEAGLAGPDTDGVDVWTPAHTLKNVVLALTHPDGAREIVVVGLPGDRDVDDKRAEVAFAPAAVGPATDADFARHPALVKGYIGPWSPDGAVLGTESATGIRYLVDPRVATGTAWVTGANADQTHAHSVVAGRDFLPDGVVEVATVRAGDPAPDGSGPVDLVRGMEIGHVFQLGRFFAERLGLKVLDETGRLVTVTMGSYGIGVTRLLAILAERNHDPAGLAWPEAVAPFDVHIVAAGKDPAAAALAEDLAAQLEAAGRDVLYDDRASVSPGVKFADAELIGVPWILVAGRDAPAGRVELRDRRGGSREVLPAAEAVARLLR